MTARQWTANFLMAITGCQSCNDTHANAVLRSALVLHVFPFLNNYLYGSHVAGDM